MGHGRMAKGLAVHRPSRTGRLTAGGTLQRGVGDEVPCSWATRLHKDSMVIDSNTRGEAVSAIYMYMYVYIYM